VWPDLRLRAAAALAALAAAGVAGAADETSLALADGPGRELTQASCSMCHSVDYILINAPFQDRTGWEKTVTKMVKVFGAPLTPEDNAAIVAYLAQHYGPAGDQPTKR
jgi:mono/diheme cytochrome c family protein